VTYEGEIEDEPDDVELDVDPELVEEGMVDGDSVGVLEGEVESEGILELALALDLNVLVQVPIHYSHDHD